jgi:MFS transporter, NNP family, nitrate/nitrite transporter
MSKTIDDSLKGRLGPVLFLTVIFTLNFTSRIILSPLSPSVEQELQLGHADIGICFFMITAGYFVSLICSGFVSSWISHRHTIALSIILVGCVTYGISRIDSAASLGAGMFMLGVVTGIYLPSGIASITDTVRQQEWGKALAIHEFAPNLGYVAAPLVVEAVLMSCSWRVVLRVLALACIIAGMTFYLFGVKEERYGTKPDFTSLQSLFTNVSFVIMVLLFGFGISSTLGVYSMLPAFLVERHGMERADANALVAMSRISTLLIVFIAGWVTDRFGAVRTLKAVLILSGVATACVGIAPSSWIAAILFLQPVMAVSFFPAAFALLAAIVSPESRNLAVSFAIAIAFMFGGGAVPAFIGLLGDAGWFGLGFVIVGFTILLGGILLVFAKLGENHAINKE